MISTALDVIAAVLLIVGTAFTFVAAIGLFRMRDVYARIHVATKPATLGVALTSIAAMLQVPFGSLTTKLLAVLIFQFWSIPAASQMLGRAARRAGVRPAAPDLVDDFESPPEGGGEPREQ